VGSTLLATSKQVLDSHVGALLLLPVQKGVETVNELVTFKPTHIYNAAEDIFLREPCFSWPGVKLDALVTSVPMNMEAVQRLQVRYCGPSYNRPAPELWCRVVRLCWHLNVCTADRSMRLT
jgi:hypothetical protein